MLKNNGEYTHYCAEVVSVCATQETLFLTNQKQLLMTGDFYSTAKEKSTAIDEGLHHILKLTAFVRKACPSGDFFSLNNSELIQYVWPYSALAWVKSANKAIFSQLKHQIRDKWAASRKLTVEKI